MTKILVHGLGHGATSWNETVSYMESTDSIFCPDLKAILGNKEANYTDLYSAFAEYCNRMNRQLDICGISLGGIMALNYALDFPYKVNSLVLIGTPYKTPKRMLDIQNMIFRFVPKTCFKDMVFGKKDILVLGSSMKNLDFSEKVQDVRCHTLIVCGGKDRANLKSAYYLCEHIKNAEFRMIENAGHVVNEENPEALAGILNEYYDRA